MRRGDFDFAVKRIAELEAELAAEQEKVAIGVKALTETHRHSLKRETFTVIDAALAAIAAVQVKT